MKPDDFLAQVTDQYARHVNPYQARLMAFAGFGVEVEAEGCYVTDHEGRKFLDCLGGFGVFALGHRHPKVVEAVKRQLEAMPMSCKTFFNSRQAELAERLAQVAPKGLEFTFFSNSGAEAVEAAMKMAKIATGRAGFVSTTGGYHGKTLGALSVTGRDKYRSPAQPLLAGVEFVPYGDAGAAEAAMGEGVAAFIVEPVQGEGGVQIPPPGYLAELRRVCDKVGALLIVDEVQTGVGRTGRMFGSEHDGVMPDLMPLAKALGGGVMPIGATMGTEAVWQGVFGQNPLMHTSTFGGNQLACAAAIATLDIVREEGLVERSAHVGALFLAALKEALAGQELVAEVRGKGLLIGIEFAVDEIGELIVALALKRGLIVAYTLNNPRVIRIEPPLVITEEQARWAVQTVAEAVTETTEMVASLT
ncbi:MAG: aspartate aminotransferase family protein [Fimbriimonadaceae bacterium]|nr:aspartate aminotransferase family protein [Fimbriimonadaceae bacterium]QYK54710.1 MAG: aspartate aminotransferase family protein [Fimbriimonadaceae bacterium]